MNNKEMFGIVINSTAIVALSMVYFQKCLNLNMEESESALCGLIDLHNGVRK